jgi:hypothetical protein
MTYYGKKPELDMTPDGRFRAPPGTPLATRIARTALVIAILSGIAAALILTLWFALALIPVALAAALVAWAAFRFQLWRVRRASRGRRDLYRA